MAAYSSIKSSFDNYVPARGRSEYSDGLLRSNSRVDNRLQQQYKEIERARKVITSELSQEKKNVVQSWQKSRRLSCPSLAQRPATAVYEERLEADRAQCENKLQQFLSSNGKRGYYPLTHSQSSDASANTAKDDVNNDVTPVRSNRKLSAVLPTSHEESEKPIKGPKQDIWHRLSQPKPVSGKTPKPNATAAPQIESSVSSANNESAQLKKTSKSDRKVSEVRRKVSISSFGGTKESIDKSERLVEGEGKMASDNPTIPASDRLARMGLDDLPEALNKRPSRRASVDQSYNSLSTAPRARTAGARTRRRSGVVALKGT